MDGSHAGSEQPSQSVVTTTAQQPLPAPGYVVKPVLQTGVLRLDHNGLPAAGQVRRSSLPPWRRANRGVFAGVVTNSSTLLSSHSIQIRATSACKSSKCVCSLVSVPSIAEVWLSPMLCGAVCPAAMDNAEGRKCLQGEQADAALADGDTDDEGSDWESASDAEDEQEGADAAQPMATAEAGTDAAGAASSLRSKANVRSHTCL